jgi:hypothetical protein
MVAFRNAKLQVLAMVLEQDLEKGRGQGQVQEFLQPQDKKLA